MSNLTSKNQLYDCTCEDWKVQVPKINAPIQLQSARSGFRWQYDGKPFQFCPWCGWDRSEKPLEAT